MGRTDDPYLKPTFGLRNRVRRFVWSGVWWLLCIWTPRPLHVWRIFVLRCFGAKLSYDCAIYPNVKIWAPWNLFCDDSVAIAEGVEIYNPKPVFIGSHSIISQGAYLCGATHDHNSEFFDFVAKEIRIGKYAWISARSVVMPGVTVGDGSVLALGAVATKDLLPWHVYGGVPAKVISVRKKIEFV